MEDVVSPRELAYNVAFHQWFNLGLSISRTLPAIWVHMCSVAYVSRHAATGNAGQDSSMSSVWPRGAREARPRV